MTGDESERPSVTPLELLIAILGRERAPETIGT
jgi:hypothetical protein